MECRRCLLNLSLVAVLGAMLKDPRELHVVEHPVLDRCLAIHFVHILVSEPVPDGGEQFTQPILVDDALIVTVEAAEGVLDHLLGVRSLKTFPKHGQEHREVDRTWSLVHHILEVVVSRVLAEGGEHVVQVLLVDEAVPVVVNHVERLLELLNLILIEHGEHIAGGSLGPFLGGSSASGCLARGHLGQFNF